MQGCLVPSVPLSFKSGCGVAGCDGASLLTRVGVAYPDGLLGVVVRGVRAVGCLSSNGDGEVAPVGTFSLAGVLINDMYVQSRVGTAVQKAKRTQTID